MRRVISVIVGTALTIAGIWWGYEQLLLYTVVRSTMLAGAGFLVLMGGYILWVGLFDPHKRSPSAKRNHASENDEQQ
jgi:hypothetical protein